MPKLIWREEWGLLIACAVIPTLTMGLAMVSFPLWVPLWTADFKVSRSTVMLGFMAMTVVSVFAAPLAGRALASVSARVVMIGGALVMTAGFILVAALHSFWAVAGIYASLIAVGSAFAGLLPAQTVALRRFPDRAGAIGGMLSLIMSLGSAVAPLVIAPTLAAFGWRPVFVVMGVVISAVGVPLAWFFLKPQGAPAAASAALEADAAGESSPTPTPSGQPILSAPAFWLILAAILPIMLGLSAIGPNLAAMAADAGLGLSMAGYLVSGMSAGAAVGGVAVGWMADRVEPKVIFTGVTAVMVAGLCAVLFAPVALMLPGLVGFGLAAGGVMPLFGVIILRRFGPVDFPRVQGLITPFMIPAFVGPLLAAWIRDQTGHYDLALVGLMILMLPGMAAVWALGGVSTKSRGPAPLTQPAIV